MFLRVMYGICGSPDGKVTSGGPAYSTACCRGQSPWVTTVEISLRPLLLKAPLLSWHDTAGESPAHGCSEPLNDL